MGAYSKAAYKDCPAPGARRQDLWSFPTAPHRREIPSTATAKNLAVKIKECQETSPLQKWPLLPRPLPWPELLHTSSHSPASPSVLSEPAVSASASAGSSARLPAAETLGVQGSPRLDWVHRRSRGRPIFENRGAPQRPKPPTCPHSQQNTTRLELSLQGSYSQRNQLCLVTAFRLIACPLYGSASQLLVLLGALLRLFAVHSGNPTFQRICCLPQVSVFYELAAIAQHLHVHF